MAKIIIFIINCYSILFYNKFLLFLLFYHLLSLTKSNNQAFNFNLFYFIILIRRMYLIL